MFKKISYKLKRILFKLSPKLAEKLNISFPFRSRDRDFLENEVFAYLNTYLGTADKSRRLLFVGLDKHNWHYHRLLNLTFHTIDIDRRSARYGQKGLHCTGSATSLQEYYEPEYFDAVVANGMIGFGINTLEDFDAMLAGIAHISKPGAVVVLGYSDLPERVRFVPSGAGSLGRFREFTPPIPAMDSPQHQVLNEFRHRYWFLQRL
ncbi:MAG TPA: class I SAM-dependent methyltransferase [Pusillimonas sp.]|uniref:class I SAM-dependent methyltransferase n=1 Tax=Pusillimonas sp. TaxID=3040095 RepID=UPI002B4AB1E5|nr:class I SAM-dependent methyltransferase [Pusillimonas sp.]HLU18684.1 class I SAM-dependent methyltransferase [Pusillimonas sp.]